MSRGGFGPAASASTIASANASASKLPPLMKGSRLSVLSIDHAAPGDGGGFAPSCGPGGMPEATSVRDGEGGGRDRQQAWVERDQQGGHGPGEDGQDDFPFLAEDEMVLPDDRFEVQR